MLVVDHTLTDAQIKALPTTPVLIVPGNPHKAIVLHAAELILNDTAGAYTNVSTGAADVLSLHAGLRVSSELPNDELLGFATKQIGHINARDAAPYACALSTRKGQDLELLCVNTDGDFTGGHADNYLRVIAYFNLIITG